MGTRMAKHLIKAGYTLFCYNRTHYKVYELVKMGATLCYPTQMAAFCDFIILMVGYPKDVEDIVFGRDYKCDTLENTGIL